ncbi:MAG: hypothetical protein AAGC46_16060, partial [Solirubrobacteraceae bacterium]
MRARAWSPRLGRAAVGLAATAGLGVLLAGCESTQAKNAAIEKQAAEVIRQQALPFSIGRKSRTVKVKRAVVVSDDQGSAVALELKVGGGHAQSRVPIVFSVKGKDGKVQFTNTVKGLQDSLQHLGTAVPHQRTWWVNDQLLGAKDPVSVKAEVGDGVALAKAPEIKVTDTDFHADPAGTYYEGTLINETGQDLTQVPVFGVGLKGDTVVAAGRGIVPRLPAKAGPKPTRFRIFFTGD